MAKITKIEQINHLYRNLEVLKHIQQLILEARWRGSRVVQFVDEKGEKWELRRLLPPPSRSYTQQYRSK
jgi:hypothetical protein